jgi:hypothetical protein
MSASSLLLFGRRCTERPPTVFSDVDSELWVNLGDDGLREAAYRGG